METKKVDVERGWGWIMDGWSLFIKNPGVWVLMILIIAAVMIVLSFVPLLGPLAVSFIGILLAGGLLYGASKLDAGGTLQIIHLFKAFQDSSKTGPMLILGLISLVTNLIMGMIGKGMMPGAFMGDGMMGVQLSMSTLFGLLLLLVFAAALAALLFYAIPLVMLKGEEPFEAIKLSVTGTLQNWLPLLVFALIYTVLSIVAAIPMGLGFLILGPVTVGAWYQSYKDIYIG